MLIILWLNIKAVVCQRRHSVACCERPGGPASVRPKLDSKLVTSQRALVAMVIYFQAAFTGFSVLGLMEYSHRLYAGTICTQ